MLNTKVYSDVEKYFVPLLPVAAQGCLPENFDELLKDFDYEKILCPLQNMTLAVIARYQFIINLSLITSGYENWNS